MDIAVRRQGVPRAVLVFAVLALLIILLVATVAFIGTRPSQPPLTAATNGLLAFANGSDLVVVEPDGTGRRTLISGAFAMGGQTYSPDGLRLAYWSKALAGGTWDLTVVDADGANPVTVASGVSVVSDPSLPAWSPDGSTITYSASDARRRRIVHAESMETATSAGRASSWPRPMDPARGRSVTRRWMREVRTGHRTAQRSRSAVAVHRRRSAFTST